MCRGWGRDMSLPGAELNLLQEEAVSEWDEFLSREGTPAPVEGLQGREVLPGGCAGPHCLQPCLLFPQETTSLHTFSWEERNSTPPTPKVTSLERTWT